MNVICKYIGKKLLKLIPNELKIYQNATMYSLKIVDKFKLGVGNSGNIKQTVFQESITRKTPR